MAKKFAWSWSKLKNYRSCPKRHYHIDLAKDFKENESQALRDGNIFHDTVAQVIDKGLPLPAGYSRQGEIVDLIKLHKSQGADVSVELKLAMTEQFQPCAWFAPDTWFRGVIDVQYLAPWVRKAAAIDWKTGGKIQPEFEQLALNAQLLFVHHPEVDEVITAYRWTVHAANTVHVYKRADMTALWAKLMPEVKEMEEAARTLTYPPKPSGLCVEWCPVSSCPHYGKGSRA